jgi:hypothetical protein
MVPLIRPDGTNFATFNITGELFWGESFNMLESFE